ncbi:MAG: tRNA (N(6)-L-threonylcarbamoyladenosine(37)-C(2))-methylthiotransferase [Candidatus Woesearchaeota archaeon]
MATVSFITQGCSANYADTEMMMGILEEAGYQICDDPAQAEVVVFNTCTVKGPTEAFFKKTLETLRMQKKKIVLTGCIPQAEKNLSQYADCSLLGPSQIRHIATVVKETLEGRPVINLVRSYDPKIDLPKVRKNPLIEITQIATGCTDACAYCKTKHARGGIRSTPPELLVASIREALAQGVREIWLTSQDNGAYGKDLKTNLVVLLRKILEIKKPFKLRIGMANPNHLLPIHDELLWLMKDDHRLFHFLHIPVQSGSNAVLSAMQRAYRVEEYVFLYRRIKEELPACTIATDVICGYPTETEEDHQKTLEMLKTYPPEVLNISKFWPRPDTPAASLKQLPGKVVKRRTKEVAELYAQLAEEKNKAWIGWEGEAIVDEISPQQTFVARNQSYRPIVLQSTLDLFGKKVKVRIHSASIHDLRGYLLDELGDA